MTFASMAVAACGDGGSGTAEDLWSYSRLGLTPPAAWDELVRAESRLDTAEVRLHHDVYGRMWANLRVVKPGSTAERFEMRPARIGVRLVGVGQVAVFGPLDPLVYFLDHTAEGFHQVWRHVVLPVGSELIVEAQDWGDFRLEEGRLVLHEDGVEFVPGRAEMPTGLCERYAGMLLSGDVCGEAAVRPRGPDNIDDIPVKDRLPGMRGVPRGGA